MPTSEDFGYASPEDEQAEADITAEEALGIRYRPAAQGVKDMEARLAYLNRRLAAVNKAPHVTAQMLADLRQQIEKTKTRLAEYKTQVEGRN